MPDEKAASAKQKQRDAIEILVGEKTLDLSDPAAVSALLTLASTTADADIRQTILTTILPLLKSGEFDYSKMSDIAHKLPRTLGQQIVYVARPVLHADEHIDWVVPVVNSLLQSGNVAHDPVLTPYDVIFSEEEDLGRAFRTALNVAIHVPGEFDLPEWVGLPLGAVRVQISACLSRIEREDLRAVRVLDAFTLLRSRVVLADLNTPSYGGSIQAVQMAHFVGIPVIGISNKATNNPWIVDMAAAITTSDHQKILRLLKTWLFV